MSRDIYKFYNKIEDRRDFEKFLELFYEDFKENKDDWENITLDHFLESLTASNRDTTDKQNLEQPTWRLFADLLLTAKVYE